MQDQIFIGNIILKNGVPVVVTLKILTEIVNGDKSYKPMEFKKEYFPWVGFQHKSDSWIRNGVILKEHKGIFFCEHTDVPIYSMHQLQNYYYLRTNEKLYVFKPSEN